MSIGPPPSLGGGLAVGACPDACYDWCDPKYFPVCTNDCWEQMKCCQGGGDGSGGGGGGGSCGSSGGNGNQIIPDSFVVPLGGPGGGSGTTNTCGCGKSVQKYDYPPSIRVTDLRPLQNQSGSLCSPPDGTGPELPPNGPFSSTVINHVPGIHGGGEDISDLFTTCLETGVTQTVPCGGILFFHATSGTKNYTTLSGTGNRCTTGGAFPTAGASGSGATGTTVTILVNLS